MREELATMPNTHTCTAPGCTVKIVTPPGRRGVKGRPRTRCQAHTRARKAVAA